MPKEPKPKGVVLVFLALAILFGATDSLTKLYRDERVRRAETHYRKGEELAKAGKPAEAVEEYHAALTFSHNDSRYELALALSLMKLGRLEEAASHLLELHESDPNNAQIDLLLARIAARQGRTEEAVTAYHQAIYGLWPEDPEKNRVQARFGLVDLLTRTGQSRQALAELLALADEAPNDGAVLDRIGDLLLQHGSPEHAEEVFARVLDANPRDAQAAFGTVRAEFLQGNYATAETWGRKALHLNPGNDEAKRLLDETAEILSLDPTLVSLPASQRYQRSRTLVEKTADSLERCLAGRTVPADTQALLIRADEFLRQRKRREGDTPLGISLAERIWQTRKQSCGPPPASEEALDRIMTKIAK